VLKYSTGDYNSLVFDCQVYGGFKMNKKQIGFRILGLRKESGLMQQELAQKLGLDRSTLSKIENGENAPTVRVLIKLRQLFSISVDWVLTGRGPREHVETYNKEVNELLIDMKRCPLLMHNILSAYYQFKLENPQLFGLKKKIKKKTVGGKK
jgi:transcriptional regulator with XRE-family HTH domain